MLTTREPPLNLQFHGFIGGLGHCALIMGVEGCESELTGLQSCHLDFVWGEWRIIPVQDLKTRCKCNFFHD